VALRNSWQKELGGFFSYGRCTWYHNFKKIIGTIQSIRKAYQSRSLHLKTRTVCLSTIICVRLNSSKRFLRIKNTMMEIIDEKIMTPVSDAGSGTCSFVGCSLYIMPLAFHFYLSCPIAFSQQLSPPFPSLGGLI